ncbi:hypothetical protein ZWY2020_037185 [Hordeum vulgare]|nr:hypothetical protein ZWY2020_037185 [Hordeum vulgare]
MDRRAARSYLCEQHPWHGAEAIAGPMLAPSRRPGLQLSGTDVIDVGSDLVNSEVMNCVPQRGGRRRLEASWRAGAGPSTAPRCHGSSDVHRGGMSLWRMCITLYTWHLLTAHVPPPRLLGWPKARKSRRSPSEPT